MPNRNDLRYLSSLLSVAMLILGLYLIASAAYKRPSQTPHFCCCKENPCK